MSIYTTLLVSRAAALEVLDKDYPFLSNEALGDLLDGWIDHACYNVLVVCETHGKDDATLITFAEKPH
jgi:hypothetical protein